MVLQACKVGHLYIFTSVSTTVNYKVNVAILIISFK